MPEDVPPSAPAIPARDEEPAIDPSVLEAFNGLEASDGTELTDRILKLFLNHAPKQLSELETQAQARLDHLALAGSAHALKSVCSSIGARAAAAACHELEEAAMSGNVVDPAAYIGAISREIHRAVDAAKLLRASR